MRSFDFYDTLFTRLVATPSTLFSIVETATGIPGFATARLAAEREANARSPEREIALDQIYDLIDYPSDRLSIAKTLELQLEQQLVAPIVGMLDRVAPGDLVVSDMYLPEETLRSILDRHVAPGSVALIVSSASGTRKLDGSMWREVLRRYGRVEQHIGDNFNSDVKQPRRLGICAEHYRGARLNRFEQVLADRGVVGNIAAGVTRAARLSLPHHEMCAELEGTFASVIAPVLIDFVDHVLADCARKRITELFFLARDGQILYRVAQRLIAARQLPLQASYVYGSRHALHLAAPQDIEAVAHWLLEDSPILTAATIAGRGNLPIELVTHACRKVGISAPELNIEREERGRLREAIRQPEIVRALASNAASRWEAAYSYYRRVGFEPGQAVAIVDVGWTGRMQRSLRSLLDRAGEAPVNVHGYYLCLSQKVRASDHDELYGHLFDPVRDRGFCPYDAYRPVIEASLLADHGSTLGFSSRGLAVTPVLSPPPAQDLAAIIERQQNCVLRVVDLWLQSEAAIGERLSWPRDAITRNLRLMLRFPTASDAKGFVGHRLGIEQGDAKDAPIVRGDLRMRDLLDRQSLALWPEGTLALSGKRVLQHALAFVRFAERLRRRAQSESVSAQNSENSMRSLA